MPDNFPPGQRGSSPTTVTQTSVFIQPAVEDSDTVTVNAFEQNTVEALQNILVELRTLTVMREMETDIAADPIRTKASHDFGF